MQVLLQHSVRGVGKQGAQVFHTELAAVGPAEAAQVVHSDDVLCCQRTQPVLETQRRQYLTVQRAAVAADAFATPGAAANVPYHWHAFRCHTSAAPVVRLARATLRLLLRRSSYYGSGGS
eukprot:SAG25_NODE_1517_length_2857_cov_1.125453_4_plen_119_part_01